MRGLAVFETGDPVAQLVRARETFLESGSPSFTTFEAQEVFDDFCVYEAQVDVPTYQAGTPPFMNEGGGFRFDEEGHPIRQGTETARVVVTLPRSAMPEAGYPLTFFVRTGGGGDRPLVDRGFRPVAGGPAGTPGTGPALHLARAGVAGPAEPGRSAWRNPQYHRRRRAVPHLQYRQPRGDARQYPPVGARAGLAGERRRDDPYRRERLPGCQRTERGRALRSG